MTATPGTRPADLRIAIAWVNGDATLGRDRPRHGGPLRSRRSRPYTRVGRTISGAIVSEGSLAFEMAQAAHGTRAERRAGDHARHLQQLLCESFEVGPPEAVAFAAKPLVSCRECAVSVCERTLEIPGREICRFIRPAQDPAGVCGSEYRLSTLAGHEGERSCGGRICS